MKTLWILLLCASCAAMNELKVGELGLNTVYEGMSKSQLTPPLETLKVGDLELLTYYKKYVLFRDDKLLAKRDYQDYDAYHVEVFKEQKQDATLPLNFVESEGDADLVGKAIAYLRTGAEYRQIALADSEKIMHTKVFVNVKQTAAKNAPAEYVRTLDLVARDKSGELVWRVTAISQGESDDLAKALPKLVAAAVDSMMAPNTKPVEKLINPYDGLLTVIVDKDFIAQYSKR